MPGLRRPERLSICVVTTKVRTPVDVPPVFALAASAVALGSPSAAVAIVVTVPRNTMSGYARDLSTTCWPTRTSPISFSVMTICPVTVWTAYTFASSAPLATN